jgi:hypothetical protein
VCLPVEAEPPDVTITGPRRIRGTTQRNDTEE